MNTGCTKPVLYDMSRKDYKNEKMKLNAREKIGLKLLSIRQILPLEQQPKREKKKSHGAI